MGYQVQIRNVNGGEWGGSSLRGWTAIAGTLNQTGEDDDAASTFDSEADAAEAVAFVRAEIGDDCEGYEVRVTEV